MTATELSEVLEAGFQAARGHDIQLAAVLAAMRQKCDQIAARTSK